MSIKIMSQLWDTKGYFSCSEKMVLLKLADCAADDGTHAYPSFNTLGRECELDPRSVKRIMVKLYEKKIIIKTKRAQNGLSTSNMYAFNMPLLKHMCEHPVDKCRITGEGKEANSDTMSPGGVTQCHQGSDTMSPKPSTDPSLLIINVIEQELPIKRILKNGEEDVDVLQDSNLDAQIRERLNRMGMAWNDSSFNRLSKEVRHHVLNRKKTKTISQQHALNSAIKLIKEGRWSTPRGMINA